jgi:hypothetical protein
MISIRERFLSEIEVTSTCRLWKGALSEIYGALCFRESSRSTPHALPAHLAEPTEVFHIANFVSPLPSN